MGNYDRYPETRVIGHDCDAWEGAEAVAAKLAEFSALSDHTAVVECYPGVDDEVLELFRSAFKPDAVVISDDIFYDGDDYLEEHTGLHELEFIETRRFTSRGVTALGAHPLARRAPLAVEACKLCLPYVSPISVRRSTRQRFLIISRWCARIC